MHEGGHHGGDAPGDAIARVSTITDGMADTTTTRRDVAPGMAAIATALARVYGYGEQPTHWGTESSLRQGGDDPLEGVSAFPAGDHWHYVTYGLTELYDNEHSFPQQAGESGWGFELTFRLARLAGEPAPTWPVGMLQRLARYVFKSSNVFRPGDHMDLNGPMGGQKRTDLNGALFTQDSQLAPIETRHGQVRFLQVVGITDDELDAVKDWRCEGFLELYARRNRLLVTDLFRSSLLTDTQFAAACREGARQEGSSHGSSFASVVQWEAFGDSLEIVVGAIAVRDLRRMLELRLPFNRPFRLHGRRASVHFVPGLGSGWQPNGRDLVLSVPWDAASSMREVLQAQRGRYEWPGMPGVVVVVKPTDVRGSRGELIRVIG